MKPFSFFPTYKPLIFGLFFSLSFSVSSTPTATESNWQDHEKKAKGQQVYFHAWGGSQEINQYLQWVKQELETNYGIHFHHVKISDTSESIQRLLTEKIAGKNVNGTIDMIWVNGENFASLKKHDMLYGPFVDTLPNWKYVDKRLPVDVDFSEPTNGLEAPWGMGQLVFIYDTTSLKTPPKNADQLLAYAKANPNRLSYPRPPEFHGVSFLKSLLAEKTNNDPRLSKQMQQQDYHAVTQPLWDYLDQLHPVAWRQGKQFPAGTAEMIQMLDDGVLDLAITFNPNAVYASQASGQLADSTKAYAFDIGALTNIHFLAIPKNASAKSGALVAINFLLSPAAQSRKGDNDIWGDPTVLHPQYLTGSASAFEMFPSISEIHPSWQLAIEKEWLHRYGK